MKGKAFGSEPLLKKLPKPAAGRSQACFMKERAPLRSQVEGLVWVFRPENDGFVTGVWSSKEKAETWIRSVKAAGVLSAYVLDESAYDSNVRLGYFEPRKPEHSTPEFKKEFTTAIDHTHYPFSGDE